ncbi:MAG: alkaline phosphatase family protein [Candidatus Velthaea sp.]
MRTYSALLISVAFMAGCGGGGTTAAIPPAKTAAQSAQTSVLPVMPGSKIKHVLILVQENRTVDNLFNGFPGADTVSTGVTHAGQRVPLKPTPFEGPYDPDHSHQAWVTDYDHGRIDGFDVPQTTPPGPPDFNYAYVPQTETVPYWTLAKRFTFADRNFAAETGPSYPGHQYLIAGQSDYAIGNPNDPLFRWGCDAQAGTTTPTLAASGAVVNGPFPCYNYSTLGDLLDQKNVSWRYYTEPEEKLFGAGVQPYSAIRHIRYGADWSNVVTPQTQLFTDIAAGQLASVTWVNPPLIGSDHAQESTNYGPDWIANIVNAVAVSPYWKDTAIFVTWDDWGGWYDHVPPPQLDRMGLSFRVPLVVVSPWANHGYVSHYRHEPGSILKFVEQTFGLGSLGTTDLRADNLADCFDFTQTPPPYVPVRVRVGVNFFVNAPPDTKPIDY